jgi:hypothetical protein
MEMCFECLINRKHLCIYGTGCPEGKGGEATGGFIEVETQEDPGTEKLKWTKPDVSVTDPGSTGRKRAVKIKPIEPGDKCEWAGLAKAGGGIIPIIGCGGNDAETVHHGPDKNTLNNSEENLHAICWVCHNRWHGINDPLYRGEKFVDGAKAHDKSTVAPDFARMLNDTYFSKRADRRIAYDPATILKLAELGSGDVT